MRILFAGSPEIALPSLRLLHERHTLSAVLTNPDRPSGRGRGRAETAVSAAARDLGLPVLKYERLGSESRSRVRELLPRPELLVVVAFGRIFGPKFLALFPRGAVNLHPSLLPRYRGPSPIPAAILNGDEECGVTIQQLGLEMDSGDLLAQVRIPLAGRETTGSLTALVAERGAELLADVLDRFDTLKPVRQDPGEASYCKLIAKADGIIDWRRSAAEIDRMVRAYSPWPEAQTSYSGIALQILEAQPVEGGLPQGAAEIGKVIGVDKNAGILVQTGNGLLAIEKLKLRSKKALNWKDFLNGAQGFVGSILGS